ncbi:DUF429 domain-containing protein [Herbiconiux sp. P18]|uniref:DUF429 domain-containing protein n=1 Tax=Herbiconiux liangxiaofengii TaxID=3342795 RepID=UPI0035B788A5
MRVAGVDLAAEAKGTALAVIEWNGAVARLERLDLGVDDALIVGAALGVHKLGIDCALGWPDAFVEFVRGHAALGAPAAPGGHAAPDTSAANDAPTAPDGGMDWRRTLAYRETDRRVRQVTGRWPLSVSTDRLGLTAMRCAGLLGRLAAAGVAVDRAGGGRVAEVYPGASLRLWGFDTTGYRVGTEARERLLRHLVTECPWLDLGGFAELMTASGDAFDAVVAALAARSAALGRWTPAPPELLDQARREGWIALPTGPVAELATSGTVTPTTTAGADGTIEG